MPTRLALCAFAALIVAALRPTPATAHDAGEARLDVRVSDDGVRAELLLARVDALDLLGLDEDAAIEDDALYRAIARALPEWLAFEGGCRWAETAVEPRGLRGIAVVASAPCPDATALDWKAARHPRLKLRAIGSLTLGDASAPFTLGRADPPLALAGGDASFGAFLLSGVEHILIGWDHLAFLLAILIGCGTLRRVVAVVTAFTVAHSITLALGATGVLVLPSGPVEALIAASIAVAAAVGLARWRAGTLDHPGGDGPRGSAAAAIAICFGFGLVHGLGFAGLLAEMLPPDGAVLAPLVAFNLGVEIGQIAVVGVLFPVLAFAGRHPIARRSLPIMLTGLVGLGLVVTGMRMFG